MKKLIIFFAILLIATGCSHQEQNNSKVNNKNETTLETSSEKSNKSNFNKNNSMQKTNQGQLENLTEKYSQAILKTNLGDITVELYSKNSPTTVNNFLNLAKNGFYDETKFHRIIKDFMIQGGDPLSKDDTTVNAWGTGGPGYNFEDEFNEHKLVRGSFAMANSGPNTNGSQFFIVTATSTPWLDGKHTNFGKVISGLEIIEKIEKSETDERDRPKNNIFIKSIELIK